jgi:hypothetical protein
MCRLRMVVRRTRASQTLRCDGDDEGKGLCVVGQRHDRVWSKHCQLFGQQKDWGESVASERANRTTADSDHPHQALTMTVAANCKQVLTIAIAVFLFNLHINFTNGIGILLTLIGGVSRGAVQAGISIL